LGGSILEFYPRGIGPVEFGRYVIDILKRSIIPFSHTIQSDIFLKRFQ
jgi:hypothetical protein